MLLKPLNTEQRARKGSRENTATSTLGALSWSLLSHTYARPPDGIEGIPLYGSRFSTAPWEDLEKGVAEGF